MEFEVSDYSSKSTIVKFTNEESKDFDGKLKSVKVSYENDSTIDSAGYTVIEKDGITIITVGIGDEVLEIEDLTKLAKVVIDTANSLERTEISIDMSIFGNSDVLVTEMVILLGVDCYKFTKYKKDVKSIKLIEFVGGSMDIDFDRARYTVQAVTYTRDLQNENASVINPRYIMNETCGFSYIESFTTEKISVGESSELKLIYQVGKGSADEPGLAIIEYKGDPTNSKVTALVGKGVTYDSGGLSLKPSASMQDMRMDMSGAAVVLGVMRFLSNYSPNINVVAAIPLAENAIGPDSYRVGDIFSSYGGKTVEVLNTDAEGRLILADALSYVIDKYEPTEVIDLATLTGAVLSALGENIAGVFTNDNGTKLINDLGKSSDNVGELIWQLPLTDEHRDAMKSDTADLRNMSKIGRNAGASTAAAFLENFVGDLPWVHIDIAGTAMSEKNGGTGWGVRLILDYLL